MATVALSNYLRIVRQHLRLGYSAETEILNELKAHIDDRLEEMKKSGLSDEDAIRRCLKMFGSARSVARQIYEAHSQGTWRQTLLAATPHLLFAALFALNWWQSTGWRVVALVLILGAAFYGRWRGRPAWLFPWLGWTLLGVVLAGLTLIYLPRSWSWIAIVCYIPLALWLIYHIAVPAIRQDWLYGSLMSLPVPIIIGWFLAAETQGFFPGFTLERVHNLGRWIGLSFFLLALTAAMFVRLRQRWLKGTVLFISGLLTLALVAFYTEGRLGPITFLILIGIAIGLFLTPALIERKIRSSRRQEI